MSGDMFTDFMKLTLLAGDEKNWTKKMNDNLKVIDAVASAYFQINGLKGTWSNSTDYAINDRVVDTDDGGIYSCFVPHTSASIPTDFASDRGAHPTYWTLLSLSRGFGTAAYANIGTGPGNILQLDDAGKLPAVDGTQLTGMGKLVAYGAFNLSQVKLFDYPSNSLGISRISAGVYTITFNPPMLDANYVALFNSLQSAGNVIGRQSNQSAGSYITQFRTTDGLQTPIDAAFHAAFIR